MSYILCCNIILHSCVNYKSAHIAKYERPWQSKYRHTERRSHMQSCRNKLKRNQSCDVIVFRYVTSGGSGKTKLYYRATKYSMQPAFVQQNLTETMLSHGLREFDVHACMRAPQLMAGKTRTKLRNCLPFYKDERLRTSTRSQTLRKLYTTPQQQKLKEVLCPCYSPNYDVTLHDNFLKNLQDLGIPRVLKYKTVHMCYVNIQQIQACILYILYWQLIRGILIPPTKKQNKYKFQLHRIYFPVIIYEFVRRTNCV